MDRGSTPLTSTIRNSFTINIYVTQQFDEGMKEILLGLIAVGTAPYSAQKIENILNNDPAPIEQKITALKVADEHIEAPSFKRAVDRVFKQYEAELKQIEDTPPEPVKVKPNRKIQEAPPERSESKIKNLASNLIKPSEIYGTDIGDPRNRKFLRPYTDDVGIYTIGIGHKIGDGTRAAKNKWVKKYGSSISPQFAEKLFDKQLSFHLDRVKDIFEIDNLSNEQAAVLVDISYRGDLLPKMQWVDLLKKGKNKAAANEYLDHKEYKRRKAKGRDGVVKRMERNAGILASK